MILNKWKHALQGSFVRGLTCQCVWYILGVAVALTLCNDIRASPLAPAEDFDSQVEHLLKTEMLTQPEITNLSTVFLDFQTTLQTKWPGSEVIPLGSFVTGLASKTSDADCMVKVPHHDISSIKFLVMETAQLLKQHPELYYEVQAKVDPKRRIPLLKFKYIPTRRNCDVNFISNIAVENSHMMGYYFALDKRFLSLAAILKFWSKVHDLRSTKSLASNSLNLLIIFYLQQLNIAPPLFSLQKHLIRCPINIWETNFERLPHNSTSTASLYELLGGFFKYYSEFNFDEYVVSPFLGRPMLKRDYRDINSLPKELFLYKNYMQRPDSKPLTVNTRLCVQDPIELRRNTAAVALNKAIKFISHVKYAAKIFDVLSKDLFLRVLLRKYNKDIISAFRRLSSPRGATGFCSH